MKRVFLLLLVLLLTPLFAYAQQNALDVVPKRETLLNGLPLVILERPGSGSVAIHLVIKSGSTFDLVNKAGTADLAAQFLQYGAGGYTYERFQQELEDLGARLEIKTDWDSTEFKMLGNNANFDGMLDLLKRMLTDPKLPKVDFEQLKAERLKQLEANPTPAATEADETFYHALYGRHPYGHNIYGTKESVKNITRNDMLDYTERFYLANNSAMIIAGDITAERAVPVLKKAMGGWKKGQIIPYTFKPPTAVSGLNIHLLDKATAGNVELRLGAFALKRTDPNYLAMRLLMNILAQRLSQKGAKWQTVLAARKLTGPFMLAATVPSNNVTEVINNAIAELKRLSTTLEPTEVQAAKDRLSAEFTANINTNTELAARWAELENYNLGSSYFKSYPNQLANISVDQLQKIAGQYLNSDNLTISVMGRASELETPLKSLGKVELIGQPKAPAPAETKPAETKPAEQKVDQKVEQKPVENKTVENK